MFLPVFLFTLFRSHISDFSTDLHLSQLFFSVQRARESSFFELNFVFIIQYIYKLKRLYISVFLENLIGFRICHYFPPQKTKNFSKRILSDSGALHSLTNKKQTKYLGRKPTENFGLAHGLCFICG